MVLNNSYRATLEFRCPRALGSSRLHLSMSTLYSRHELVLLIFKLLLRWILVVVLAAYHVVVIALAALLCDSEFLLRSLTLLLRCSIIHHHFVLVVLTLFWKWTMVTTGLRLSMLMLISPATTPKWTLLCHHLPCHRATTWLLSVLIMRCVLRKASLSLAHQIVRDSFEVELAWTCLEARIRGKVVVLWCFVLLLLGSCVHLLFVFQII